MSDFSSLIFLLGFAFYFFYQSWDFLHVDRQDEALYLGYGFREVFSLPASWSPIYGLWYRLYQPFFQDPLRVFLVNSYLQMTLLPTICYGLLRKIDTRQSIALLAACLITVAGFSVYKYTRINNFNLIFLLALILISLHFPRFSLPILAFGLLFSLFIRGDNLIYLLIPVFCLIRSLPLEWRPKHLCYAAFYLLSGYILFRSFGNPLESDRFWRAFIEHFYWQNPGMLPKQEALDAFGLGERIFPGAHNVWSAALINPSAFTAYVLRNWNLLFFDLPKEYFQFIKIPLDQSSIIFISFFYTFLFLPIAIGVKCRSKQIPPILVLFVFLSLAKTILFSGLISSASRYHLDGAVTLVILWSWAFEQLVRRLHGASYAPVFLLCALSLSTQPLAQRGNELSSDQIVRQVRSLLPKLNLRANDPCFSFDLQWIYYQLPLNCVFRAQMQFEKEQELLSYLKENKFKVAFLGVIEIRRLIEVRRLPPDFLDNLAHYGFSKHYADEKSGSLVLLAN